MTNTDQVRTLQIALAREKIARRLEVRGLAPARANSVAAGCQIAFVGEGADSYMAIHGDDRAIDTPESLDAFAAKLVERIPEQERDPRAAEKAVDYDPVAAGRTAAAEQKRRSGAGPNSLALR